VRCGDRGDELVLVELVSALLVEKRLKSAMVNAGGRRLLQLRQPAERSVEETRLNDAISEASMLQIEKKQLKRFE
jgi:hypothetical protein